MSSTRGHSPPDFSHILTDYIPHNPLPGLVTSCNHISSSVSYYKNGTHTLLPCFLVSVFLSFAFLVFRSLDCYLVFDWLTAACPDYCLSCWITLLPVPWMWLFAGVLPCLPWLHSFNKACNWILTSLSRCLLCYTYDGAWLWRDLKTKVKIWILTGNQFSEMWSNLRLPVSIIAAVFWTICKCIIEDWLIP